MTGNLELFYPVPPAYQSLALCDDALKWCAGAHGLIKLALEHMDAEARVSAKWRKTLRRGATITS
jgi:hypothetical protein